MKRRHNAQFWLLMTVLAVVGGASAVGFNFSGLNAENAHVNVLRQQTEDEKSVQAQLEKSQKDLETAKEALTHLEQGVPSTAYVPTMLQQLQKTGQDCGISVTGVRPAAKQQTAPKPSSDDAQTLTKPAYDELDIDVKGRGNYDSTMKFVKALETFPKIVGLRTIEIVPCLEIQDQKAGLVDITVGLRAYLFHDTTPSNGATDGSVSKGDAPAAAGAPKADASKADASKAPASSSAKPAAPAAGVTAKTDAKAKATSNLKGKEATA